MLDLGDSLGRSKNDPQKALNILKLLDRKAITGPQLIETKIGKRLTAVSDKPDSERPTADTPELLEEVTKMKDHLKKKWTLVHQEFKSKSKPKVPTQAAPSVSAGAASAGKSQPSIRLPYIPGGKHSYT